MKKLTTKSWQTIRREILIKRWDVYDQEKLEEHIHKVAMYAIAVMGTFVFCCALLVIVVEEIRY